ncbi:MAG: hypothetical protein IJH85_08125 [Clostridia bacterium]|nr:hypothetical protein [Clostridia bacterium]
MKKRMSILLVLVMLASFAASAQAETTVAVPSYLTPSVFVSKYNELIYTLAKVYAEGLGEEGVRILQEDYTITLVDPQGPFVYYGSKDWAVEAGFTYPDGVEPADDTPARTINFSIKAGTPEGAVQFAVYAFKMMIAYEYRDEVELEKLNEWFATAKGPEDSFTLPSYTLNTFSLEGNTQYAILPVDPAYQAEILKKLEQQGDETAGNDDGNWTDIHCGEDGFTTKIPAGSPNEYRTTKGQMGLTVYLDKAGSVPCVIVHRRKMDSKFKKPQNYLNNTYREFLENKYEGNGGSVGTNPAKSWEVGGKQLIGARYIIRIGNVVNTQIQLIEIRDLGDVEYTGIYRNDAEEKKVMDALNAAVANFAED